MNRISADQRRLFASHRACINHLEYETNADGFTYLNPSKFAAVFAGDVPFFQTEFEVNSQILTAAQDFKIPITNPAWKLKPCWAVIATGDQIISPDLERFYAEQAHSFTVTIQGSSQSVYMSHPKEVAALIEDAAKHAAEHRSLSARSKRATSRASRPRVWAR